MAANRAGAFLLILALVGVLLDAAQDTPAQQPAGQPVGGTWRVGNLPGGGVDGCDPIGTNIQKARCYHIHNGGPGKVLAIARNDMDHVIAEVLIDPGEDSDVGVPVGGDIEVQRHEQEDAGGTFTVRA